MANTAAALQRNDQKSEEELNEHEEDLSNSNEDLILTFQSVFMPTSKEKVQLNGIF